MTTKYSLRRVLWTSKEFIRLVRTRWDTLDEAIRRFDWLHAESLKPANDRDLVAEYLLNHWDDDHVPYEISDAGKEPDPRRRRNIFWALRPERIFPKMNPKLVDELKQKVKRTYWDADGTPEIREVRQHYKLWEISGDQLGLPGARIRALQCWCPTTNKEFWIMQNPWCRDVQDALRRMFNKNWCCGLLYRHGDILFEEVVPHEQQGDPLSMLVAET